VGSRGMEHVVGEYAGVASADDDPEGGVACTADAITMLEVCIGGGGGGKRGSLELLICACVILSR